MKLLITVLVPSQAYIRTDIKNWDTYGASEALEEMTHFPPSVFETPTTGIIAESATKQGYKWNVQIVPNLNYYPVIKFKNVDTGANVATITGTPKGRGVVKDVISNLINNRVGENTTGEGTGPGATRKAQQAGLGFLAAAALLLVKIKSADSVGQIVNRNNQYARNICNDGKGSTAQSGACAWHGGINIGLSKNLRIKKLK